MIVSFVTVKNKKYKKFNFVFYLPDFMVNLKMSFFNPKHQEQIIENQFLPINDIYVLGLNDSKL